MVDFELIFLQKSNIILNLLSKFNKIGIIPTIKDFADTESVVIFSEEDLNKIKNKNIFLIYQFFYFNKNLKQTVNEQLFKLFLLIDFIKKVGVKKIFVFLPYLAYSRQDKSFDKQFIGPISMIGKFFKQVGADKIIAIDLHEPRIEEFFGISLITLNLEKFWADFLKKNIIDLPENYICVAPDNGRVEFVKKVSDLLNLNFVKIIKKRIGIDQTKAFELIGEVKDKNVIIFDDIVDTGNTALEACNLLVKHGAKSISGCFTHAIFSTTESSRILNCFDKIFVTDTILLNENVIKNVNKKITVLSLADFLFENFVNIN